MLLCIVYLIISQCFKVLGENVTVPSNTKPVWSDEITANDNIIIDWLLADIKESTEGEIPNYDGSFNNLNGFNMGSIGELLGSSSPYATNLPRNLDVNKLIKFKDCFSFSTNGVMYFFLGKQALREIMDLDTSTRAHNLATPYIDGGIIYGNSRYKCIQYRNNGINLDENGQLISHDLEEKSLKDITQHLTRVWLLWHNRVASKIKGIRTKFTSEDIFNEARKWTIAIQQSIYLYEWLPFWLNETISNYSIYNSLLSPQISHSFYGGIYGLNNANFSVLIDPSAVGDLQKLITNIFRTPRVDYFALKRFDGNLLSSEAFQTLEKGLKEDGTKQCGNGAYLKKQILNQFLRIRDADRFWFEYEANGLFSKQEIEKIRNVKFRDIYLSVKHHISDNAFSHMDVKKFHSDDTPKVVDRVHLLIAFVLIFIIANTLVLVFPRIIWKYKNKTTNNINRNISLCETVTTHGGKLNRSFSAREYGGKNHEARKVLVTLKTEEQKIVLNSFSGDIIRIIDCNMNLKISMQVYIVNDRPILVIKFPNNYDLVLIFESNFLRQKFLNAFDNFKIKNRHLEKDLIRNFTWRAAKRLIVSKEHRQEGLEMFFRVAIAQAFKIEHSKKEMSYVGTDLATKIMNMKLTKYEFADALNMNLNSHFVTRIFALVDRDKKGFVSFREFIDLIILFADVNKEKKAKLLFDMYDIDRTGSLSIKEFSHMMKSFLENTVQQNKRNINQIISCILESVRMHNDEITFEVFIIILGDYIEYLDDAKLGLNIGIAGNEPLNLPYFLFAKRTLESMIEENTQNIIQEIEIQKENYSTKRKRFVLLQNIQINAALVFWMNILTILVLFIFILKLQNNSSNMYKTNMLNVVCVSSAESLLFIYSILLITLCRNVWSALDNVNGRRYFPSNFLHILHGYFIILSLCFNFLHIITALIMLFTDDGISSYLKLNNNLILYEPQYNWYLIFDLTIITGILLTALSFIPYMFIKLKDVYKNGLQLNLTRFPDKYLIIAITVLMFHGSQRKLQEPQFFNYMSGPLIFYFIDIFIMLNRKKIDIPILKVEIYPSDVVCITMRRPENFQYTIGQTVRLSIPILDRRDYHEYWLSSAPSEPNLRIYIPVVDRWSHKVFSLFDGTETRQGMAPVRIRLEGPLGNGIEYWERYEVTIFIADATGISRFASVLKDIINCLNVKPQICCQKVYFIWMSDTHKQFEWLVDLIYETESNDPNGFFSCHIFVTGLYEQFDLRMLLSFVFEKYYRRSFGKSIFTNLRALSHYSHPYFPEIFQTVGAMHSSAKLFGVFSSGSSNLVNSISSACNKINECSSRKFQHHPYIV
ncbi:hypothetical protein GWI33_016235 [Rhynchophorus ferrugineus]|uniref:NAD(P)H oxidase (H2O2-forming) n=1 Tax=Rhynchophorus ferrugineus TaxID=354439 RepID=A0A834I165_RHYFE|nr:hypothetical protein GWI33_016235 [Rhynchophorus ferrugineus]